MPNGSDRAASFATTHSLLLLRVSAGLRLEALSFLEDLETELTAIVSAAKAPTMNTAKYRDMLSEAQAAIANGYSQISKGQDRGLKDLAAVEWEAGNAMANRAIGVEIVSGKIPAKVLEAVVHGPTVLGAPALDWWNGQSVDLRQKFQREMALGTMLGESVNQLAQRIKGAGVIVAPGSLPGMGIVAKSKRDAENLVRTSVQSISNAARIEHFKSKPDIIKGIQWVATLDSRTTLICMSLDGKQWRLPDFEPIGHAKKFPGPTAHWSCRSTQISVLYSWSELAGKKLPSLDEKTVQEAIEAKLEDQGAEKVQSALAYARASMDGQVSAKHTFGSWAEDKGQAFVEQVVGKGRAEMLKAGKITFSDLTDQTNRPITIDELKTAVATGRIPAEVNAATFLPPRPRPAMQVKEAATAIAAAQSAIAQAAATGAPDDIAAAQIELKRAQDATQAQSAAAPSHVEDHDLVQLIEAKLRGRELSTADEKKLRNLLRTDEEKYDRLFSRVHAEIVEERQAPTERLMEEARRLPIPKRSTPVSAAYDTSQIDDRRIREQFEHALAVIDRVHDFGDLPPIAIKPKNASYDMQVWLRQDGETSLAYTPKARERGAFTVVHEQGHVLDWRVLGDNQGFASHGKSRATAALRNALAKSEAVAKVKELATSKAKTKALQAHAEYLARDEEIMARAYSQYIALKSNDALLMRQLRAEQRDAFGDSMYWTDSDFRPIFQAFDELLQN